MPHWKQWIDPREFGMKHDAMPYLGKDGGDPSGAEAPSG